MYAVTWRGIVLEWFDFLIKKEGLFRHVFRHLISTPHILLLFLLIIFLDLDMIQILSDRFVLRNVPGNVSS
jgi:hypothetical protein